MSQPHSPGDSSTLAGSRRRGFSISRTGSPAVRNPNLDSSAGRGRATFEFRPMFMNSHTKSLSLNDPLLILSCYRDRLDKDLHGTYHTAWA